MSGFVFERNLPHQLAAVNGVMDALEGISVFRDTFSTQNPLLQFLDEQKNLRRSIVDLQKYGGWESLIKTDDISELIFDISMETGTGKTYAYTKTMFELHKQTGLHKFIIAVPRVAIKAGTVSFLKSDAARDHFRHDYGSEIKVHEVQSQQKSKSKKERLPQAIADFCRADSNLNKNAIHVLVINAGMINSKTMEKSFDVALFDEFGIPHEAIANTKPGLIIDEPHMFKRGNSTYKNLMRFKPQFTLRYGATFDDDLVNLVYQLNAIEAFNQDLVKGVTAHVEEFPEAQNTVLRLIELDGKEASFELIDAGNKSRHRLTSKASFESVHPEMQGLHIEAMNKSKTVLSNGMELKKGDRLNPYSYAETLQEKMIQNAISQHFENERELFLQSPRIKPLTLFFIDNIKSYREKNGALRMQFEAMVKAHVAHLINKEVNADYKAHLQSALKDLSALHGGYFSADNSGKDEKIEKETLEILHDKETLLDFNNPRRFIFSKWTLREGWDNPNVFTICKLRSSGSETSKLQEVGRGLRLPVTEYMTRDKSKSHSLHYFVDFTETDFVAKLVNEINEQGSATLNQDKLIDELITSILQHYNEYADDEALLEFLDDKGIINRKNEYKAGGFDQLRELFPAAFDTGLKKGKIKKSGSDKPKATIRKGKYEELKQLWEQINQKVVLEYQVKDESGFKALFQDYISNALDDFEATGSKTVTTKITVESNRVGQSKGISESKVLPFKLMTYKEFLQGLAIALSLNIHSLHEVFLLLKQNKKLEIDHYLSQSTIRKLKSGFNDYLMQNAYGKFQISYQKTSNKIHPTKFTTKDGTPHENIASNDVGTMFEDGLAPKDYLFDEIFYDGELELQNIKEEIDEIIVYSKIPKNSIRIPLVGGGTYSPDFAYVIKGRDGKSDINLVVETKGKNELDLSELEKKKIEHANSFFADLKHGTKVHFHRQLSSDKMLSIIKEVRG
ncbi:MAG: type III restriction-modification system endonuclease [Hyphomicrobiales bacterium]